MDVNDGPLHDQPVFTWLPSLLVPNKLNGNPSHTGALLLAITSGTGLTVIFTVCVVVHPEAAETVTLYV